MLGLTELWTAFTWAIFNGATTPKVVIPVSVVVIFATLLLKGPAWIKPIGKVTAFFLAVYLTLATPFAAYVLVGGLTTFLPDNVNADETADAVVVLSRGDDLGNSRYDLAIQLWQKHRAPKIFVTAFGRVGYMMGRFKAAGWPLSVLDGSTCAKTTYEEAISAAAILQPQNVKKVILITDSPHMLRSVLTFQTLGFETFHQIVPFPPELPALEKSFLALREYFGLVSYAVLGRLSAQVLDSPGNSSTKALQPSECSVEWLNRS